MKTLTTKVILKEREYGAQIAVSGLFALLGILISAAPLFYLKALDANAIIGIAVCTLCFGLPLGVLLGLKRLIPLLRQRKALVSGDFRLTVDTALEARMLTQGVQTSKGDFYCQLRLEAYSQATGKYYTISRRLFDKTREGDRFYLVYLGQIGQTIAIFPLKEYELSQELNSKLTQQYL